MRIVIDLQGGQTASRHRGIGRYTLSLSLAMARNIGNHELLLALNGNFPEGIDFIHQTFAGLIPAQQIHIWYGPEPGPVKSPGHLFRLQAAQLIRETFLASLKPDIILIPSLFEGFDNAAITSIGLTNFSIPVAVSFHDFIPLSNPRQYLDHRPDYAKYYRQQVECLKRADLWLPVSNSAARELQIVGINEPQKIVCIANAADQIFSPKIDSLQNRLICEGLGISGPFVFYSGGVDPRKNVKRLLEAYELLPAPLQDQYQIVLAGKINEEERNVLRAILRDKALTQKQLIFTDYVSDEILAILYSRCTVFVQPSLHEGFGLPALEAMACGAPVIGSNLTSIPEVIGREDVLFDPYEPQSICEKITKVLTDEYLQAELAAYGIERAKNFTWDISAHKLIDTFSELCTRNTKKSPVPIGRPRLALVSPLPPERTGIAEYAAQLLPQLSRHFEIEMVVTQNEVDLTALGNIPMTVRNTDWLLEHGHEMDYVVYQFGNSLFHSHMFELLEAVPGVVVLHDFFISDLLFHYEFYGIYPNIWTESLYYSHGYGAVQERFATQNPAELKSRYPVNLRLLEQAQGVIVHSKIIHEIAQDWYGKDFSKDWQIVPLVRTKKPPLGGEQSRHLLGLNASDYLVCSFGFLDFTKSNLVLLQSWLDSSLSKDPRCKLIFVGENHGGDYGQQILQAIADSGLAAQIQITGWVDENTYQAYLESADCAVQLRTQSRGETSAAVLDCLMYGIPTIVNAHGAMTTLPIEAVKMLPEYFSQAELTSSLELLCRDQFLSHQLAMAGEHYVKTHHSAEQCVNHYIAALTSIKERTRPNAFAVIDALVDFGASPSREDGLQLAQLLMQSFPQNRPKHQLLIDITATHQHDLRTGIERVTRGLMQAFIANPPEGFRVEPVYLSFEKGVWEYRYARKYVLEVLGCPKEVLSDDIVEVCEGDILLGLDISGQNLIDAENSGLIPNYRHRGVKIYFVIYDLLPLLLPHFFPEGMAQSFQAWLEVVLKNHGVLCISQAVENDLKAWLSNANAPLYCGEIGWFHQGADFENSFPSSGIDTQAQVFLQSIEGQLNFLMVGTIEPRKAHLQVIEAFTQLWQQGFQANLIIVGKEGWEKLPKSLRRTIPRTIETIKKHPKINKHLFWLSGVSDAYLTQLYQAGQCLIMASEGEGFGLPLLEAARYGTSILARDLPVFREVLGSSGTYFSGRGNEELAHAILKWCEQHEKGEQPIPQNVEQQSWQDSAQQILKKILPNLNLTA